MSGEKGLPEYIGTGEMHHDGTIILRPTREKAGRRFHDEKRNILSQAVRR